MTTVQEKIAVMQAFADGKQIEEMKRGQDEFFPNARPSWNWVDYVYRVKPTVPEYRLFFYKEEQVVSILLRNMMQKTDNTSAYALKTYSFHVETGVGVWLTDWLPIPNL